MDAASVIHQNVHRAGSISATALMRLMAPRQTTPGDHMRLEAEGYAAAFLIFAVVAIPALRTNGQ